VADASTMLTVLVVAPMLSQMHGMIAKST